MKPTQVIASGVLAVLLAAGSAERLPSWANPATPQHLAQVTPGSVTGQLDENSQTLDSGRYITAHPYEGAAGETVTFELVSEDFDGIIVILSPSGAALGSDDDIGIGTNARFTIELPETGTYYVSVTSFRPGKTGKYTLSWRSATAADYVLQRASQLHDRGLELYQQGRYNEAEPLYLESLEIHREQLGERHPDVATIVNNLASLYQAQGRYAEAEPRYQLALEIRREQLGDRHPSVATSLNNLALLYRVQGRCSEAEPRYQLALEISREQLGERHPDVATSLNNLALLYQVQGRYSEAEPLHQLALEIRREQLGERHPDVALSLHNLAGLYLDQGRYTEAEPHYLQAVEIFREQLGERHPDVATSLNNLANLYQTQERYSEAEPRYQLALEISREQLGERHPDVATRLNNLAALFQAQGRYSEAEPLHQLALEIRREQLGERHPDVALSLHNLAGLYQDQGRHAEAEPHYLQALEIFREQLGKRHPHVAISLHNLANLYQAQGNTTQALAYGQAGLEIEEWNLDTNLATLAEAQRQAYVATISQTTNWAISFHLQAAPNSPEAAQLALTTLLRRKGRILDAGTSSLQLLRQNLTPEDQTTLDQLADVLRELSALTFNPPPNLSPEDYQARLTPLETEANQLETTLARRSATFRVATQPIDIATVQAKIPANGVLVEYVLYYPYNAADDAWSEFPHYAAYFLFPNGNLQSVDLGEAAPIDDAVESFRSLLQDPTADLRRGVGVAPVPTLRPDYLERVTTNIKTLVFDPIAPYLANVQHLLISPDSQLNRLPFEALQPETGGDYLVQQYQISYLNTGRDLVKFGIVPPSTEPAVVLANPDYDSADGSTHVAQATPTSTRTIAPLRSTELSQLQVTPLPGTAAEVEAIRPLLDNPTILTTNHATENALKSVRHPRILHIATHGFFLADIQRSPNETRGSFRSLEDSRAIPVGEATENPLLRSGLALAGFNPRTSGSEDGVLTALEAAQLNLFGTQLVVLSACETGLGDVANGEGVYGLRRAFSLAGAETQLMSLWRVSDDGTKKLMTRYYEKLTQGIPRSQALREVQLEAISSNGDYSRPYYWAAFILAGEWR